MAHQPLIGYLISTLVGCRFVIYLTVCLLRIVYFIQKLDINYLYTITEFQVFLSNNNYNSLFVKSDNVPLPDTDMRNVHRMFVTYIHRT